MDLDTFSLSLNFIDPGTTVHVFVFIIFVPGWVYIEEDSRYVYYEMVNLEK